MTEELKYSKDGLVVFRDSDHSYKFTKDGEFNGIRFKKDERLTSVTTAIHSYSPPFDPTGEITEKYALENCLSVEDVKTYWRCENQVANVYGSYIHLGFENFILGKEYYFKYKDRYALDQFKQIPFKGKLLPEKLLYNAYYKIAGQADLTELCTDIKTGKKYINIWDYKGLPLDTPILTSEGWKNMGELNIGDKVYDEDGKLCNVIGTSDIHNKKCLEMKFNNNQTIISDFEHRWKVFVCKGRLNQKNKKYMVMTTQEIKNYLEKIHNKYGENIPSSLLLKIDIQKPLDNPDRVLPIDPYTLGVWLGGSYKVNSKIIQANEKIFNEIIRRGYKLGKDISESTSVEMQTRIVFDNIYRTLSENNLVFNKRIPDDYLLASYKQRLDLLRGFMDATTYYNKKRNIYVISTIKQTQLNIIIPLLSSLGVNPTVSSYKTYYNGMLIDAWNIEFTISDFNPFLCRKNEVKRKKTSKSKYKVIEYVKDIEQVQTKCIEVDSPSHTFLCTKYMTITHNTNKELVKTNSFTKMLGDLNYIDDCNFNHYQIQLSIYKKLYELSGMEVRDLIIIYVNKWTKQLELHKCKYMEKEVNIILNNHFNGKIITHNK